MMRFWKISSLLPTYTGQEGDTAHSIARLFVIDESLLRRVNRIPPGGDLNPGTRIRIPPQTP